MWNGDPVERSVYPLMLTETGAPMPVSRCKLICVTMGTLLATARLAAQVTTGSVTGTVKDVQGGVIPGAMVTLVSDTKGTKSAPVVTGGNGDFVFPSVSADVYTVEIQMPSFKTLRRSGVSVGSGTEV